MENKIIIERLRDFLEKEQIRGKTLFSYRFDSNQVNLVTNSKIKVGLSGYNEIILEEETGLELGGVNRKSFAGSPLPRRIREGSCVRRSFSLRLSSVLFRCPC